ncbi:MAG TPA: LamB/YcsF family protein, partial [Arthrobacter bacterium]|nr:LamB/YcsF family protein [Arthrobacter sp.]
MATIDLNSDVGESFGRWSLGDDLAIFGSVSSANVACGFHAGDPSVIRRTCRDAVAAGVVIGAHVGYRDLAGFGRRFLDISPTELANDVVYQIGA